MTPKDLHAALTAYEKGRSDGLTRGVYANPYRGKAGPQGSAYKAGFDRGLTQYCEAEHLDEEAVPLTSSHAFNVAFAASQLAARIERAGTVNMSERIAAAAIGVADAEAEGEGVNWDEVNYDETLDRIAILVEASQKVFGRIDEDLLENLRRDAAEAVRTEVPRA